MLPPFRIRDLYGQARHGVVQITKPEYDSTVKSHPDAALTYLDEDDGETITVGSGFELSQRLEEPIPVHKAAYPDDDTKEERSTPHDLHMFDVQKTSNSIATWMDHEAYSSKTLRNTSCSTTASNRSTTDDLTSKDSRPNGEESITQEEPNSTELDMYEQMHDKEVQLTTTSAATRETQASVNRLLVEEQQRSDGVEKIVTDALDSITYNLDSHIDILADFLQNTSKALRMVAEKTRESDITAVEGILSGFNSIFGEVGRLAKSMLEPLEAAELGPTEHPVELSLEQSSASVSEKDTEMAVAREDNELSASTELVVEPVRSPSPVLASSPRPVPRVNTLQAQNRSNFSAGQLGTEITARLPMSQLDRLYHIPSKSFIDSQPTDVSVEKDMYATLERGGFNPDSDRTWKYMPLPEEEPASRLKKKVDFALPSGTVRPSETAKSSHNTFQRSILDLEASDPDFSARFPPLLSVRRSKTMSSLRQRSQSPDSRTRSRQDALTRYPSLQQLERRRFSDRDVGDNNRDHEPTADTKQDGPVSYIGCHSADKNSAKSIEPAKDEFTRQRDEVEKVIAAVGRDITEASDEVRRLPGAWPEAQVDAKASHLPTSNESSGEFFNRMTGQGTRFDKMKDTDLASPSFADWRFVDEPYFRSRLEPRNLDRPKSIASFKPSATLTTPFDPLVSPALVPHSSGAQKKIGSRQLEAETEAEEHSGFEKFFGGQREDSLTKLSMPNAQPLYPTLAEAQEVASHKFDGIRRSGTERMPHRRPYSHRYSGAGRLPWEDFEDQRNPGLAQRLERTRRSAHRPGPPPSTTRQNPSHPIRLPSDLHKRVNEYRNGLRHRVSAPSIGIAKQSKINDCVQQLKDMGFGKDDVNEASRLTVYASVSGGDIFEAVDMIEEDRKAGDSLKRQRQSLKPENGLGGWL